MSAIIGATSRWSTFHLWFNCEDNRYQRDGYGLHCGDGLSAKINGEWVETRVEHSSFSEHSRGWYLVTHPEHPLAGLEVRKEVS